MRGFKDHDYTAVINMYQTGGVLGCEIDEGMTRQGRCVSDDDCRGERYCGAMMRCMGFSGCPGDIENDSSNTSNDSNDPEPSGQQ